MAAFKNRYGATPLHLLSALASFAVAGYAVIQLGKLGPLGNTAFWFVGVIVAHDLVLLPLYSLVQRIACRVTNADAARAQPGAPPPPRIMLVNHLRVPVIVSGLLFLLFFPAILQRNEGYLDATGMTADVYLGRWAALSAALFVLSGLLYAIRRGRSIAR